MMETSKHDQPVRMHSRLDEALVARVFRAAGRVHIPEFLDVASAARIHRALAVETPWRAVLFDGREHRELEVASLSELPARERKAIIAHVDAAASRGFSYRYASFRLYENWQHGLHRDAWLMRVLEFLNSPPFLELMRRVTGDLLIGYADAQATKYGPGDFLTRHDDRIDGKDRRAALNALNLFRVPMLHAVTQVSSFAVAPRCSITGWLRRQQASA
jgi:Rps23 Pro-64 3,4-dihydroxylase Tpa1-like proline 4-hydroxylase